MDFFRWKLNNINPDFIRKNAAKIKAEDVGRVLEQADTISRKFQSAGPLKSFLNVLKDLFSMVADYWSGRYRDIPYWAISSVVFALLYVLWPIDVIPDVVPVIGMLDDAMVVSICLAMIKKELEAYRLWKASQPIR